MRVRMKIKIGGAREGEEWPDAGQEIELPDNQGADLVTNGYAEEVKGEAAASQPHATAAGESDGKAASEPAEPAVRQPRVRKGAGARKARG